MKVAFKNIVYNKTNPKEWRIEKKHKDNDFFDCIFQNSTEDVRNTSIAEVTERKILDANELFLLVNFEKSRFDTLHKVITACCHVQVIKNNNENKPIEIDCLDQPTALENWLNFHLNLNRYEYDITSRYPPSDEQTILNNPSQFQKTTYFYDGRQIYKEIKTGFYWYVDNLHYGKKSHLEVFDKMGNHLGEANYLSGEIDISKQESKKSITKIIK